MLYQLRRPCPESREAEAEAEQGLCCHIHEPFTLLQDKIEKEARHTEAE